MRKLTIPWLALAILLLASCDQKRLSDYTGLATAGSLYVQQFHLLAQSAGSAMIAGDSATFIAARHEAGPEGIAARKDVFAQRVVRADKDLAGYLATLAAIDAHATALGQYFATMAKFTDAKNAASVASAASGVLTPIETLEPQLKALKFGGKSVDSFVAPLTNLVVAHFEVKALDEHFKTAGPVIDRALTLHEAAVACISQQMRDSISVAMQDRENSDIVAPYIAPQPLPGTWNADREAFLRARSALDGTRNAAEALKKFHAAYRQLIEKKDAQINLQEIFEAVNKIAGGA